MELVSVIIPVYNAENFVSECIDSIINQSWTNWEVILIDDGSTDNSLLVIKNKVGSDNRFSIVTQQNSGAPAARNRGLLLAKGEYIQFLDADDELSPDKLKNQVQTLELNPNSVVWCLTQKFCNKIDQKENTSKNLIIKKKLTSISSPLEFLLCLNGIDGQVSMIQPNAYLVSAALINKAGFWNEALRFSPDDDSEFFTRVIINADQVLFDSLSINYYRVSHLPSVSKRYDKLAADGALLAILLKFSTILKYCKTKAVNKLFAHHLSLIAYLYGCSYPDIIQKVKRQLRETGVNQFSLVGGFNFKLISIFIGFENTIKLKSFLK